MRASEASLVRSLCDLAGSMARQMNRPTVGLSLYAALCGGGVLAFTVWVAGLLQPTAAQNPGLAAYKPPPGTVIEYVAATPQPQAPHDALILVEPGGGPLGQDSATQTVGISVLQHPIDVKNVPAAATDDGEPAKTARAKRQRSVRQKEPRSKNNQFAFQSLFGIFRR
jgi:hypothetical protein